MSMKLTVVGCSPAWPNPGGAQSGYLLEGPGRLLLDCGPGVLARLRSNGANGWPEVDAIVISHFHLDHWGDLVPWVWGTMWGLGQELKKPELWLPPGGREELAGFGTRFGTPDMFIRVFEPKEYAEGEEFEAAGLKLVATRLPHYTVQTYGFRVSNTHAHAGLLGRLGPERAAVEVGRRGRPLPVRGDVGTGRAGRGAAWASLGRRSRRRVRSVRCEAAAAHAPPEGAQSGRRPRAGARRAPARRLARGSARQDRSATDALSCRSASYAHRGWRVDSIPTRVGSRAGLASVDSRSRRPVFRATRPRLPGAHRTSRPSSRTRVTRRRSAASGSRRPSQRLPSAP